MSSDFPMFQFEGLQSSTSLAAMSVVTTDSFGDPPPSEDDSVSYVRCLEEMLKAILKDNILLRSRLNDNIFAQTIPKVVFVRLYPTAKVLLRRMVGMTQHLVLQDRTFRRRPGVKMSHDNIVVVGRYANESIIRVTRGQATNGPTDQDEHGIIQYVHQIVSWVTGEVVSLADGARHTGRSIIRDHYRFHGGNSSLTHNARAYRGAMDEHAYIRDSVLVSKFFRQLFMVDYSCIAFQMELLYRETPAAFEVHPSETPIVLWSVQIPSGAWELVLTVIHHLIQEWKEGRWQKAGFDANTAALCDALHVFALAEDAVHCIVSELSNWFRNALATKEIDLTQIPAHILGENTE